MKKFLLGTVALVALGVAAPALAADLPARTYTKAPAYVAPMADWTGFYIGVFGGGGWGRYDRSNTGFNNSYDASGALVGGEVGYNWQLQNFLLGLEGDIAWSNLKGDDGAVGGALDQTTARYLATIRGRAGFVAGQWLFFGTGGVAFTELRHSNTFGILNDTFSRSKTGWTAGAGIEYAFAPNWSAKVEYRHYDFGSFSRDFPTNGVLPYSVKSRFDTITVGVNYKWGGPVVAKY